MHNKLISELQHQSTWRLLGLSLITLFVYPAYYIKRQTAIINQHCLSADTIPVILINSILIGSYISVSLLIASCFVDGSHPVTTVSDLIDRILNVLFIIWAFKARNRMNLILASERGTDQWFNGWWTFFFGFFYFNFKINKLKKNMTTETVLSA
jgi:hypothetical protein